MGDAVKTCDRPVAARSGTRVEAKVLLAGALAVLGLLGTMGCASSQAPTEVSASAAEETAAPAEAEASPSATDPLMITGIELREGAPESFVEISSVEPLVWTSFRDADGFVVVELPNAVAGPEVADLEAADGLVSEVLVEREESGVRPMTRLRIATRQEAEHSLRAEGAMLIVALDPVEEMVADLGDDPMDADPLAADPMDTDPMDTDPMDSDPMGSEPATTTVTFEPIADDGAEMAADEPAAEPTWEPAPRYGSADQPLAGPAPSGARATRLSGVQVESAGEMTVVEVRGDGEFAYSTFRLSSPERFVIDLEGVTNGSSRSAIPVGSRTLERVRVAQFRPQPSPVARVVFDLTGADSEPRVERTPDALVVRVARAGAPAVATVQPTATYEDTTYEDTTYDDPAANGTNGLASLDQEPYDGAPEDDFSAQEPPRVEIERADPVDANPMDANPMDANPMDAPRAEPALPRPAPPISDSASFDPNTTRIRPPGADPEDEPVFGGTGLSGERRYVGDPIDMSLRDADVVETLRSFAKISDLNIVIQPEVSGRVTVELENVPWDQALEQILKINGLGYELEGNILRIATLRTLSEEAENRQRLAQARALSVPLSTMMTRLSYTDAEDIARILRQGSSGLLSQRGSVIVDERTNTLIIKELPEYMDTVLSIVDNLDDPEPQVMIEARIIETTKRFSRQLGISWNAGGVASSATGNSTGLVFPNNVSGNGGVNLIGSTPDNGFLGISLGNVLNTFRLDAVLQAAESDGLVNILSAPRVATLNNRRATIQSGVQIPVQTIANNTITVQFVNATLRLEVTPQITADGTVVMDINIQKREVQTAFLLEGATNAPISTKEARTQVLVRDGGTAVIGGIYEVSTDQGEQGVPGLANIPILGHLFKNRRRTDENEELLIFITPRVVRL